MTDTTTEPGTVPDWRAAQLLDAVDRIDLRRFDLAASDQFDRLVSLLDGLRQVAATLRVVTDAAEDNVIALWADRDKRHEIPGLGVLERHGGHERKRWQSAELVRLITRGAITDRDTGELPDSPVVAVDRAVAALTSCLPVTASTRWKVGGLRSRGLDPDDFCDADPARPTIQIHKGS